MKDKLIPVTFILCIVSFLLSGTDSLAVHDVLKTSKVRVGEKAPVTDSIKKANSEGRAIVVTLLPGPMGCRKCDAFINLIQEEASLNRDVAFILKGGEDILGATDEETILLKKNYGFVTMGEAWSFIIDKEGVLRKILIGPFSREELKDLLESIKRRKE